MKQSQDITHEGIHYDRNILVRNINRDHDYYFASVAEMEVEEEEVVVSEPYNKVSSSEENEQITPTVHSSHHEFHTNEVICHALEIEPPADIDAEELLPSTSKEENVETTDNIDKDAIIADLKKQLVNKNKIIKRLKKKVSSLKQVIANLRKNNMIDKRCEDLLQKKFSGPSLEIYKRLVKGGKYGKYSENFKSFALTLHFYSRKAYNFLRKSFNLALPHPNKITSWYSKIPANPGFTEPAFKALELKVILNRHTHIDTDTQ